MRAVDCGLSRSVSHEGDCATLEKSGGIRHIGRERRLQHTGSYLDATDPGQDRRGQCGNTSSPDGNSRGSNGRKDITRACGGHEAREARSEYCTRCYSRFSRSGGGVVAGLGDDRRAASFEDPSPRHHAVGGRVTVDHTGEVGGDR